MKRLLWLPFVTVALIFAGLGFRFADPSSWHALPLAFAVLAAAIALAPGQRFAAIVSALLWVALIFSGNFQAKLFGPVGFAAIVLTLVASVRAADPIFASWMIPPAVFFESAWVTAFARQSVYELSTAGHVTDVMDPCTSVLMPLGFAALVIAVACLAIALNVVASLDHTALWRWPAGLDVRAVAIGIACTAGVVFGIATWHDWQISQPCL